MKLFFQASDVINYVVAVHAQLFSNSSIVSVMIQIFIQNAEPFAGFFCVSFPQFQKTGLAVKKGFVFYRILKQEILNPEILKKKTDASAFGSPEDRIFRTFSAWI